MSKTKKSNQAQNPLVSAKAGTQSHNLGNQSKPLLDSRVRGNERSKAAAVVPDDDDEEPVSQEEFRRQLIRTIQTMRHMYRRCRAPICRRVKRCASPSMCCVDDFPLRKLTPEKEAAAMAALYRAVQRLRQQRGLD
jgi:hypothetical protein